MLRIRTVNHKTATTTIVDEIRQRILNGVVKEGEKLGERDIALEFGTSRVPVREAFKVLESEGYLEVRPRSGTSVKAMDRRYMRTVGDVYVALVPLIIMHCLPSYDEKILTRAEETIAKIDAADDPVTAINFLTELRDLFHSPAEDIYAYKVCRDIYLLNRRALATVSSTFFEGKFPTDGYKRFISLIRSKDFDEAVSVYTNIARDATLDIQRLIESGQ